ncbi:hypothetical protein EJB05_02968, partial [Eragrostis curvula]
MFDDMDAPTVVKEIQETMDVDDPEISFKNLIDCRLNIEYNSATKRHNMSAVVQTLVTVEDETRAVAKLKLNVIYDSMIILYGVTEAMVNAKVETSKTIWKAINPLPLEHACTVALVRSQQAQMSIGNELQW